MKLWLYQVYNVDVQFGDLKIAQALADTPPLHLTAANLIITFPHKVTT